MPTRTCVVCRKEEEQSELLRFVRSPEAAVFLDLLLLLPGRGTYAHGACLKQRGAVAKLVGRMTSRKASKEVTPVADTVFLSMALAQAKEQLARCKELKRKQIAIDRLAALEQSEKDKIGSVKETKIRL